MGLQQEVPKMKLGNKIATLRKHKGLTQDALAELCGVSRQAISKWETGLARPDAQNLLKLGRVFDVSMDLLMKDGVAPNGARRVRTCGSNAVANTAQGIFEGTLIKESLEDDAVLDLMNVHRVELWNTGKTPRYWTALFFTSQHADLPVQLSRVMIADERRGGNWYIDMKCGSDKYIVFRNKILKYRIGDEEQKRHVCRECRRFGITDAEMDWSE